MTIWNKLAVLILVSGYWGNEVFSNQDDQDGLNQLWYQLETSDDISNHIDALDGLLEKAKNLYQKLGEKGRIRLPLRQIIHAIAKQQLNLSFLKKALEAGASPRDPSGFVILDGKDVVDIPIILQSPNFEIFSAFVDSMSNDDINSMFPSQYGEKEQTLLYQAFIKLIFGMKDPWNVDQNGQIEKRTKAISFLISKGARLSDSEVDSLKYLCDSVETSTLWGAKLWGNNPNPSAQEILELLRTATNNQNSKQIREIVDDMLDD